jgi:hypothetical protein
VDILGIYCDKNGDEQFAVKLQSIDIIPESHYNLISITRLMDKGHSVKANKKDGITVQKGGQDIKFEIRVEMPKGVLWCAYIKRNEPKSEIAAESGDLKSNNQPAESKKGLKSAIKMNIERAHAILGHSNEHTTQKMAAALNMQISMGSLKTCEPRAVAKARQMDVNSKSEGSKAEKFNGRMHHDIAIVKESNNNKKLGHKSVWHVIAAKMVSFKASKFFVSKSKMTKYMCEYMESEKVQGHPIAIIRQDNAGENKKLVTLAHSKGWKHETIFKNTACKTPQQTHVQS